MRVFTLISFLIISIIVSSHNDIPKSDSSNLSCMAYLHDALPDSIYQTINNNPFIFFSYGHHGYSWSLVTRIDYRYKAFSGRVGYNGDKHLTPSTIVNEFDSVLFFLANKSVFEWGIDTIASEAVEMKGNELEYYVPIYDNLSIIDSNGACIFNSSNTPNFSGPDSLKFNESYHKLMLLMRWLSDPGIREYFPNILPTS